MPTDAHGGQKPTPTSAREPLYAATRHDNGTVEDYYRILIDVAPDATVVVGRNGLIRLVNRQTELLFGYPRAELIGRPVELLIPERFVAAHTRHRATYTSAPRVRPMGVDLTLFGRRRDGSEFPVEVSLSPLELSGDSVVVSSIRDISARKRLEQRTQTALDALVDMAQALTGPLGAADRAADSSILGTFDVVADAERVPDTNVVTRRLAEAALRVLGGDRVQFTSIDPETDHLRPLVRVGEPVEDEPRWAAAMGQCRLTDYLLPDQIARLCAGEVLMFDLTTPTRARWPTSKAYPTLVAPMRLGTELVGVLSVDFGASQPNFSAADRGLARATADMATLVLQRDRLLWEREAALVRELAWQESTQRMDEFMATASHDVRSPLTVTMGEIALATRWFERLAAAVLEQSPDLADRVAGVRRCLDETSQSVDRLAGLVGVLFDTALVRSGKLEIHRTLCDLVALVREAVEAQRVAHPSRTIDLQMAVASPLPVEADAVRIGQVLTNYLTNALKYSGADQSVVVQLVQEETEARVSVTDHGPGLSLQEQSRVWQAFYRAAGVPVQYGSSAGLGLGLHICKTIVERHSGHVGLDSTVGKGSTFWFTLPLASER